MGYGINLIFLGSTVFYFANGIQSCPSFPYFKDALNAVSVGSQGMEYIVTCASGYDTPETIESSKMDSFLKSQYIQCRKGVWDELKISCSQTCDIPSFGSDYVLDSHLGVYKSGETLRIQCANGFAPVFGTPLFEYLSCIQGRWTSKTILCEVPCTEPPSGFDGGDTGGIFMRQFNWNMPQIVGSTGMLQGNIEVDEGGNIVYSALSSNITNVVGGLNDYFSEMFRSNFMVGSELDVLTKAVAKEDAPVENEEDSSDNEFESESSEETNDGNEKNGYSSNSGGQEEAGGSQLKENGDVSETHIKVNDTTVKLYNKSNSNKKVVVKKKTNNKTDKSKKTGKKDSKSKPKTSTLRTKQSTRASSSNRRRLSSSFEAQTTASEMDEASSSTAPSKFIFSSRYVVEIFCFDPQSGQIDTDTVSALSTCQSGKWTPYSLDCSSKSAASSSSCGKFELPTGYEFGSPSASGKRIKCQEGFTPVLPIKEYAAGKSVATASPSQFGVRTDLILNAGNDEEELSCANDRWAVPRILCRKSCTSILDTSHLGVISSIPSGSQTSHLGIWDHGTSYTSDCMRGFSISPEHRFALISSFEAMRGSVLTKDELKDSSLMSTISRWFTKMTCVNGQWQGNSLSCRRTCDSHPLVSHPRPGYLVNSISTPFPNDHIAGFPVGFQIALSCAPGYSSTADHDGLSIDTVSVCSAVDGKWTNTGLECVPDCAGVLPSSLPVGVEVFLELGSGETHYDLSASEKDIRPDEKVIMAANKVDNSTADDKDFASPNFDDITSSKPMDSSPDSDPVVEAETEAERLAEASLKDNTVIGLNATADQMDEKTARATSDEESDSDGVVYNSTSVTVTKTNNSKTSFVQLTSSPTSTPHGMQVLLRCALGYSEPFSRTANPNVRSSGTAACERGDWTVDLICYKTCSPPDLPISQSRVFTPGGPDSKQFTSFKHGAGVQIQCAPGFAPSAGMRTFDIPSEPLNTDSLTESWARSSQGWITCIDGSWTRSPINCEPTCPPLSRVFPPNLYSLQFSIPEDFTVDDVGASILFQPDVVTSLKNNKGSTPSATLYTKYIRNILQNQSKGSSSDAEKVQLALLNSALPHNWRVLARCLDSMSPTFSFHPEWSSNFTQASMDALNLESQYSSEVLTCRGGVWDVPRLTCIDSCESITVSSMNTKVLFAPQEATHGAKAVIQCLPGYSAAVGASYEVITCRFGRWEVENLECRKDCPSVQVSDPKSMDIDLDNLPENFEKNRIIQIVDGFGLTIRRPSEFMKHIENALRIHHEEITRLKEEEEEEEEIDGVSSLNEENDDYVPIGTYTNEDEETADSGFVQLRKKQRRSRKTVSVRHDGSSFQQMGAQQSDDENDSQENEDETATNSTATSDEKEEDDEPVTLEDLNNDEEEDFSSTTESPPTSVSSADARLTLTQLVESYLSSPGPNTAYARYFKRLFSEENLPFIDVDLALDFRPFRAVWLRTDVDPNVDVHLLVNDGSPDDEFGRIYSDETRSLLDEVNIFHKLLSSFPHGSQMFISCKSGYSSPLRSKPELLTCSNGVWSESQLTCHSICSEIPNLDPVRYNSIVTPSSPPFSSIQISCQSPDFAPARPGMPNYDTLSCNEGVWSPISLACAANCNPLDLVLPSNVRIKEGAFTGFIQHSHSISLICAAGSVAVVSQPGETVICIDGAWTVPALRCALRCPIDVVPAHQARKFKVEKLSSDASSSSSMSHDSLFRPGAQRKISCSNGHFPTLALQDSSSGSASSVVEETETIICLSSGQWSPISLDCEAICPEFVNPNPDLYEVDPPMDVPLSNSISIKIGQARVYSASRVIRCLPGKAPNASGSEKKIGVRVSEQLFCVNGLWTRPTLMCSEVISCPPLPRIPPGVKAQVLDEVEYKDDQSQVIFVERRALITCADGFYPPQPNAPEIKLANQIRSSLLGIEASRRVRTVLPGGRLLDAEGKDIEQTSLLQTDASHLHKQASFLSKVTKDFDHNLSSKIISDKKKSSHVHKKEMKSSLLITKKNKKHNHHHHHERNNASAATTLNSKTSSSTVMKTTSIDANHRRRLSLQQESPSSPTSEEQDNEEENEENEDEEENKEDAEPGNEDEEGEGEQNKDKDSNDESQPDKDFIDTGYDPVVQGGWNEEIVSCIHGHWQSVSLLCQPKLLRHDLSADHVQGLMHIVWDADSSAASSTSGSFIGGNIDIVSYTAPTRGFHSVGALISADAEQELLVHNRFAQNPSNLLPGGLSSDSLGSNEEHADSDAVVAAMNSKRDSKYQQAHAATSKAYNDMIQSPQQDNSDSLSLHQRHSNRRQLSDLLASSSSNQVTLDSIELNSAFADDYEDAIANELVDYISSTKRLLSTAPHPVKVYDLPTDATPVSLFAGDVTAPVDFTLISTLGTLHAHWQPTDKAGETRMPPLSIWRPIAAPGYSCVGIVVKASFDMPSIDSSVKCLPSECVLSMGSNSNRGGMCFNQSPVSSIANATENVCLYQIDTGLASSNALLQTSLVGNKIKSSCVKVFDQIPSIRDIREDEELIIDAALRSALKAEKVHDENLPYVDDIEEQEAPDDPLMNDQFNKVRESRLERIKQIKDSYDEDQASKAPSAEVQDGDAAQDSAVAENEDFTADKEEVAADRAEIGDSQPDEDDNVDTASSAPLEEENEVDAASVEPDQTNIIAPPSDKERPIAEDEIALVQTKDEQQKKKKNKKKLKTNSKSIKQKNISKKDNNNSTVSNTSLNINDDDDSLSYDDDSVNTKGWKGVYLDDSPIFSSSRSSFVPSPSDLTVDTPFPHSSVCSFPSSAIRAKTGYSTGRLFVSSKPFTAPSMPLTPESRPLNMTNLDILLAIQTDKVIRIYGIPAGFKVTLQCPRSGGGGDAGHASYLEYSYLCLPDGTFDAAPLLNCPLTCEPLETAANSEFLPSTRGLKKATGPISVEEGEMVEMTCKLPSASTHIRKLWSALSIVNSKSSFNENLFSIAHQKTQSALREDATTMLFKDDLYFNEAQADRFFAPVFDSKALSSKGRQNKQHQLICLPDGKWSAEPRACEPVCMRSQLFAVDSIIRSSSLTGTSLSLRQNIESPPRESQGKFYFPGDSVKAYCPSGFLPLHEDSHKQMASCAPNGQWLLTRKESKQKKKDAKKGSHQHRAQSIGDYDVLSGDNSPFICVRKCPPLIYNAENIITLATLYNDALVDKTHYGYPLANGLDGKRIPIPQGSAIVFECAKGFTSLSSGLKSLSIQRAGVDQNATPSSSSFSVKCSRSGTWVGTVPVCVPSEWILSDKDLASKPEVGGGLISADDVDWSKAAVTKKPSKKSVSQFIALSSQSFSSKKNVSNGKSEKKLSSEKKNSAAAVKEKNSSKKKEKVNNDLSSEKKHLDSKETKKTNKNKNVPKTSSENNEDEEKEDSLSNLDPSFDLESANITSSSSNNNNNDKNNTNISPGLPVSNSTVSQSYDKNYAAYANPYAFLRPSVPPPVPQSTQNTFPETSLSSILQCPPLASPSPKAQKSLSLPIVDVLDPNGLSIFSSTASHALDLDPSNEMGLNPTQYVAMNLTNGDTNNMVSDESFLISVLAPANSVAFFGCPPGFVLIGPQTLTCSVTINNPEPTWLPNEIPRCMRSCSIPPQIMRRAIGNDGMNSQLTIGLLRNGGIDGRSFGSFADLSDAFESNEVHEVEKISVNTILLEGDAIVFSCRTALNPLSPSNIIELELAGAANANICLPDGTLTGDGLLPVCTPVCTLPTTLSKNLLAIKLPSRRTALPPPGSKLLAPVYDDTPLTKNDLTDGVFLSTAAPKDFLIDPLSKSAWPSHIATMSQRRLLPGDVVGFVCARHSSEGKVFGERVVSATSLSNASRLFGNAAVRCGAFGKFEKQLPSCISECSSLELPYDRSITVKRVPTLTEAEYDPAYDYDQSLNDQFKEGSLTSVDDIDSLVPPGRWVTALDIHESLSTNRRISALEGDEFLFKCQNGLTMNGHANLKCGSGGRWEGQRPFCYRVVKEEDMEKEDEKLSNDP